MTRVNNQLTEIFFSEFYQVTNMNNDNILQKGHKYFHFTMYKI